MWQVIWSVFGSNVLLSVIFYSCLAFTNVSKMAFLYHLTDPRKMYINSLHVYPSISKQIIIVTMHMYSSRPFKCLKKGVNNNGNMSILNCSVHLFIEWPSHTTYGLAHTKFSISPFLDCLSFLKYPNTSKQSSSSANSKFASIAR